MSTSLAGRTGIASPRIQDSARTHREQRRRTGRAERRHQNAAHDDGYLDRSGIALRPTVLAFLWQR
jgi:hypothetical protein